MIITRLRRRAAAAVLAVSAVLATTAATTPTTTAAGGPASVAPARAAASSCPRFEDRIRAAADRRVDVGRITPTPAWRTACGTLWRNDNRAPAAIFEERFHPRDVLNGQYDIEQYVLVNQPSPYVSTTYDHDLYKTWKAKYNCRGRRPRPGRPVGACPVDRTTKTEIMSECQGNPYYQPWH
ncbi:hypothetical protein [Streptomyces spiralis]|uniref:scabin-related ADP-ribosyltransferase n=1 Tax=Streptomyces spiralis TaxID=66376 RepID=UPI0036AEBF93